MKYPSFPSSRFIPSNVGVLCHIVYRILNAAIFRRFGWVGFGCVDVHLLAPNHLTLHFIADVIVRSYKHSMLKLKQIANKCSLHFCHLFEGNLQSFEFLCVKMWCLIYTVSNEIFWKVVGEDVDRQVHQIVFASRAPRSFVSDLSRYSYNLFLRALCKVAMKNVLANIPIGAFVGDLRCTILGTLRGS